MENVDYRLFLLDMVNELLELTKDEDLYASGNVYGAGYRSALYSVLHLIEEQAASWEIERNELGLGSFSADEWRRAGRAYFRGKNVDT